MAHTIEDVRKLAKKKGIKLIEYSENSDELVQKIRENFILTVTDSGNIRLKSKETGKKKLLRIKSSSPHVFKNICVLDLSYFADFYIRNYDIELQKSYREEDKKFKAMMEDEEFFCTGCGMWKPIREKVGYMYCGC